MDSSLVCIIILNWNGYEVTRDCLKSLQDILYTNYKIIVVDNGSEDNSVLKLTKEFQGIEILSLDRNYGFTGGNNRGIKYAIEKYNPENLLLLNNDTIVHPEFLNEMVRVTESDYNIGAVVPKIFFFDQPNVIWYAGGYFNKISGIGEHYGIGKKDSKAFSRMKSVSFMTGCAMLIKACVLNKIGLFDDQFFAVAEDSDLSVRIIKARYKIVYQPNSMIWHKVSHSFKENKGNWFSFYMATRNTILLQRKHCNFLLFVIFLCYFIFRWLIYLLLKYSLKQEWKMCKSIMAGVFDGFTSTLRYVK